MSTSSNKSQKKGEDGMGKAGKRHEMVKGTYERRACERVACMSVCVYVCMCRRRPSWKGMVCDWCMAKSDGCVYMYVM